MGWLLETQLLLQLATKPAQVSPEARALIEDPLAEVWVSTLSLVFEPFRVTSVSRKRDGRDRPFGWIREHPCRDLVQTAGFRTLEMTQAHAAASGDLPHLHANSVDRMLIAQARAEGLTLLTTNKTLARYGAGVRLV